MINKESRKMRRRPIKRRIRGKVQGTSERPRLSVFRSLKHIYVQAIDDVAGRTLTAASSLDKEFKGKSQSGSNMDAAKIVGEILASRLKDKGVGRCVFDRGGWLYHGRVKKMAEAIREGGITL